MDAAIKLTPAVARFLNTALAYAKALSTPSTWPTSDTEPETYYSASDEILADVKDAFIAAYRELPD